MAISALIALPLLTFLLLLIGGSTLPRWLLALASIGGISLSAIDGLFLYTQHSSAVIERELWFTWIPGFSSYQDINIAFHLDTLSLTMAVVVTFVSSLIALYSWAYMEKEPGIIRFFATVNLFVFFMLLLVLADNLLVLFMGWEGVGLCSYLLIGFYYREPAARAAATKAFLTTRIGDVFLLFGIIICFLLFDTLDIKLILEQSSDLYPQGSTLITIAALCFLGGAVGKSAQLPLQTWLADAMWGPTPVSALIHAATMVTAGVYLIARLGGIFMLSPLAQNAVLIIGAVTLLLAGMAAVVQSDLKRVLAYSTMSQIAYMFLALGVGAYDAAIFHLSAHAFFKALLFLSAGVIGHNLHSYDLFKMGGLRHKHALLFYVFLIGCINLLGLPYISAGFFSKEAIMMQLAHAPGLAYWAWLAGLVGAGLTGLYTTRMLMLAFFGEAKTRVQCHLPISMAIPLLILALGSLSLGWLKPAAAAHDNLLVMFSPTLCAGLGVILALFYASKLDNQWLKQGFAFDSFYNIVLLKPYRMLSAILSNDPLSRLWDVFSRGFNVVLAWLSIIHTGDLASYVSLLIVSALVMAGLMVMS